jgi:hypothetical protein
MDDVLKYLNNATISAFFGALSAYFLVQFTDVRRIKRKQRLIYQQMSGNGDLALDKIQMIKKNLTMADDGKIDAAPIMKFSTEDILLLKRDALDKMSTEEKRALDALCYTMEATDQLLIEAEDKAEEIEVRLKKSAQNKDYKDMTVAVREIRTHWNDALRNLRRFRKMNNWFLNKEYKELLNARFKPEDFDTDEFDS